MNREFTSNLLKFRQTRSFASHLSTPTERKHHGSLCGFAGVRSVDILSWTVILFKLCLKFKFQQSGPFRTTRALLLNENISALCMVVRKGLLRPYRSASVCTVPWTQILLKFYSNLLKFTQIYSKFTQISEIWTFQDHLSTPTERKHSRCVHGRSRGVAGVLSDDICP